MSPDGQPLVSVVIPTYRRPVHLQGAVESVLQQTYPQCEVVVVDDNDPASEGRHQTEALMRQYSDEPRVRYVAHQQNMNGAAARNTGIREATGDLVAFLDDDDRFLAGKLERQVALLQRDPSVDAATCGWIRAGRCHSSVAAGDLSRDLLMLDYQPITSTLVFRRGALAALGGFDESFRRHQDLELMLRFFKYHKLGLVDRCLVEVGANDGSNALHGRDLDLLKEQFLGQFANAITDLDQREPGIGRRIRSRHYARAFLDHVHRGHVCLAAKAFGRSVAASPSELIREVHRTSRAFVSRRGRSSQELAGEGSDHE